MSKLKELPEINTPVLAKCKKNNGEIIDCQIKRIPSVELSSKWQWSGIDFNTYFTLEVVSWNYINQLKFEF